MQDSNSDSIKQSYDQIPYLSEAISSTLPEKSATIAKLLGISTVKPSSAKILELGCGNATNIINIANIYPNSTCYGVDISSEAINSGNNILKKCSLKNISLVCSDLANLKIDLKDFDYIIAHGLFSWVSSSVREQILKLISESLSDHGLAYISYNTLPGWKIRGAIRDMMLYQTRDQHSVEAKAAKSRAILDLLQKTLHQNSNYNRALLEELQHPRNMPDWYLTHDFLSLHNDAFYFSEFIELISRYGLNYIADTELPATFLLDISIQAKKSLFDFCSNQIEREQYSDFIRNRMFRRSIISKTKANDPSKIPLNLIDSLFISSQLKLNQDLFRHPNGGALKPHHLITKQALEILSKVWPANLSYHDLLIEITNSNHNVSFSERELKEDLIAGYSAGLIDFSIERNDLTNGINTKFEISPLAKVWAIKATTVPNLRNEQVQLSDAERSYLLSDQSTINPQLIEQLAQKSLIRT